MLPLRLVFGLLLLLTSMQLWAEPISLTLTEPDSSASLVGMKTVANTLGAPTLDLAATAFPRYGASVRTLSTNAFPEALFDLTNPQSSRPGGSVNPRATALAEAQASFAIPEPAALFLLGSGLAVLAALTKQRKRK